MKPNEFKSQLLPVKGKLYRLAFTLLNNRPEAEDAVQDVYLKLWNMRAELAKYRSIEALAVTMTKNVCIDKLRSYRRRNKNDGGLEMVPLSSNGRHDPARVLENSEQLQLVQQIISQLSEQQRLVIHLRDFEHYSYDEIETVTERTRNNIRVTLSRARKYVREQYLKREEYGRPKINVLLEKILPRRSLAGRGGKTA